MAEAEKARQESLRKGNFTDELINMCTERPRFFEPHEHRPIVALSSFPGSGNTWARHLLHMASGYWTGNRLVCLLKHMRVVCVLI